MIKPNLVGSLLVAVFLAGCAGPKSMSGSFLPHGQICASPRAVSVVVNKAHEARPNGEESRIGIGFITFIPFVPFGKQQFTPETYFKNAAFQTHDFKKDVSETVVKDLNAAGIANVVYYAEQLNPYNNQPDTFYLYLTLKEGVWNRNFTTYGCSVFGSYLWFLGFPVSYGNVQLDIDVELRDSGNKVLGKKSLSSKLELKEWIYTPHCFTKLLPNVYGQLSPDLRNFVSEAMAHSPSRESLGEISASIDPHKFTIERFPVRSYQFDSITKKGTIVVEIGDMGFQARLWVIKNIGIICASKNIALESGSEEFRGARYRVLDESIQDGLLTINFEASY